MVVDCRSFFTLFRHHFPSQFVQYANFQSSFERTSLNKKVQCSINSLSSSLEYYSLFKLSTFTVRSEFRVTFNFNSLMKWKGKIQFSSYNKNFRMNIERRKKKSILFYLLCRIYSRTCCFASYRPTRLKVQSVSLVAGLRVLCFRIFSDRASKYLKI